MKSDFIRSQSLKNHKHIKMKTNCWKLIMAFCFVVAAFSNMWADEYYSEGKGTITEPFVLRTATDLYNLRYYLGEENDNTHFILINDIDLSFQFGQGVGGWDPIGTYENGFYGNIHGNGFTVKGLHIIKTSDNAALFGYLRDASIENLNIAGEVSGKSRVALLSAYALNSKFINCRGEGLVSSNGIRTGGLIGYNIASGEEKTSVLENCYVNVTINSTGYFTGGLVGDNHSEDSGKIIIKNCYTTGKIAGSNHFKGGFIGRNYASGDEHDNILQNSLSLLSELVGTNYINRLVGYNKSELQNNYAAADMIVTGNQISDSPSGNNEKATDISASQQAMQSFYEPLGWDFENTWYIHPTMVLPQLYSFWQIGSKSSNKATSEILIDTLSAVAPINLSTFINGVADDNATLTWNTLDGYLIGLNQNSGSNVIPQFTSKKSDVFLTATFNVNSRLSDGKSKLFNLKLTILPGYISSNKTILEPSINIFFDPSAQTLLVSSKNYCNELTVIDLMGRIRVKKNFAENSIKISTVGWNKGVYISVLQNNNKNITIKRIIIQ